MIDFIASICTIAIILSITGVGVTWAWKAIKKNLKEE